MKKTSLLLTEGDVFRILVFQDERDTEELSKLFGLSHRNTLSTYYKMSKLNPDVKEKACEIFNVSPEVFETGRLLERVEQSLHESRHNKELYMTQQRQIEALREESAAMRRQIEALVAENVLLRGATPN